MKVSKAKLQRWLNNPVTHALRHAIEQESELITHEIASGKCIPTQNSIHTMERLYMHSVGRLDSMKWLADFEKALADYDLIHKDEDEADEPESNQEY